jgi:hypothetical protein
MSVELTASFAGLFDLSCSPSPLVGPVPTEAGKADLEGSSRQLAVQCAARIFTDSAQLTVK